MTDCPRCGALIEELRSIRARIDRVLCDEPRPLLTPNEAWVYAALVAAGERGVSLGYLDEHCPERSEQAGRLPQVFAAYVSKIRRKLNVIIVSRGGADIYERRYFLVIKKADETKETLAAPAR